jgi:hypothetical protein
MNKTLILLIICILPCLNAKINDTKPAKSEPKHLNLILGQLRDQQAEACQYGPDPLIFDVCQNIDQYNKIYYNLKNIRLSDIQNAIIRRSVLNKLNEKCQSDSWCFKKEQVEAHPIGKTLLAKHSNELCLFSSCYESIKGYINNCVKSQLSKSILNVAPVFCDLIQKENKYCLEPALQLMHLSVAQIKEEANLTKNICETNIKEKKICSAGCKNIALEFGKLDSCCSNTSLIRRFFVYLGYFLFGNKNANPYF